MTGKARDAEEVLNRILSSAIEDVRLQGTLYIRAAQGRLDEAFKALMRLAEVHPWPPLVKSLPVFEKMRADPRFTEFCRKIGPPLIRGPESNRHARAQWPTLYRRSASGFDKDRTKAKKTKRVFPKSYRQSRPLSRLATTQNFGGTPDLPPGYGNGRKDVGFGRHDALGDDPI